MIILRIDPWKKCGRNFNRSFQSETRSDENVGPLSPDPSIFCEDQVEIWPCFPGDVADYRLRGVPFKRSILGIAL